MPVLDLATVLMSGRPWGAVCAWRWSGRGFSKLFSKLFRPSHARPRCVRRGVCWGCGRRPVGAGPSGAGRGPLLDHRQVGPVQSAACACMLLCGIASGGPDAEARQASRGGVRPPARGRWGLAGSCCWSIGRSAPRRVVCARGCHCTALRPSRGAVAVRRGTGMLPGPRGRCGPGCRRQSSMLAQQHAAAPRR